MAYTYLTTGVDAASASQELTFDTPSISPNPNRLLFACMGTENADNATNFVASGNGLTWTTWFHKNQFGYKCPAFTAPTKEAPSSGAVTFTWSSDAGNVYHGSVYEIEGADMNFPVAQIALCRTNFGISATAPQITFARPTADDSIIIGNVRMYNNATNVVPPAGFTEDFEGSCGDSSRRAHVCSGTPGSITTLTWGSTNPDWEAWAFEIRMSSPIRTVRGL